MTVLNKEIDLINHKLAKSIILASPYFLSVIVAVIVFLTGGTKTVYANLMYLPITLSSSVNDPKQAVIHAILSGLLIGPFMPLNVANDISQPLHNWLIRTLIFLGAALLISNFNFYYNKEHKKKLKGEQRLVKAKASMIHSLVKLTEYKDDETGEHIERVGKYSEFLAEKLSQTEEYKDYLTDDYIEKFSRAVPLHDIGKVSITDQILLKPGKLSEKEFETMKTHTTIGADIISELKEKYPNNEFLNLGENITRYHHERWDGNGYPEGLKGKEIPLPARIMGVVDVYDALRSKRPYKDPYSHEEAIKIIEEGRGNHFDPQITDIFLKHESEIKKL